MTTRDRIVLMVVAVVVVLGAAWVLVVSPERKEANKLATQVESAKSELQSAESQLSDARAAQAKYASAYTAVVNLGKAVPAEQEVPSLVYQLSWASQRRDVEFESIATGASGTAAASSAATSATSPAAKAASAGFSQMPFTFIFNGSFFNLEQLFSRLSGFTTRNTAGDLDVSGRLLTIQSVKLEPETGGSSNTPSGRLKGTISATAYRLPAGESLTGGATASSPAGSAQAVSSPGGSSSPTTPAIARVTP